jgi:hypothetical protein
MAPPKRGGRRVSEGDRVTISAGTWNTLQDVAAQFEDQTLPSGLGPNGVPPRIPALQCQVQAAVRVAPGGILSYGGSPITLSAPAGIDGQAERPLLLGKTPDFTSRNLCVVPDGLESGQIGRAVFQGITIARVHNTGASSKFAGVDRKVQTQLATSGNGLVPILHMDHAVGTVDYAIVQIDPQVANRFDDCWVQRPGVSNVECVTTKDSKTGVSKTQMVVTRRMYLVPIAGVIAVRVVQPAPPPPPPPPNVPPGAPPPPPVPTSKAAASVISLTYPEEDRYAGTTDTTGYVLFRVPAGDYEVTLTVPPGLALPVPPVPPPPVLPPGISPPPVPPPPNVKKVSIPNVPSCEEVQTIVVGYALQVDSKGAP